MFGGDLVDSRAEIIVGALSPFRFGGAEKRSVGGGVRARIRVAQLHICEDRDMFAVRRERLESRRQRVESACAWRRPLGDVRAHRDVNEAKASDWIARGSRKRCHRRDHRVEQWERERGSSATQKRPSRESFLSDYHCDLLI